MAQGLGDIRIRCEDCLTEFVWSVGEQNYYAEKNLQMPRRCRECRSARKQFNASLPVPIPIKPPVIVKPVHPVAATQPLPAKEPTPAPEPETKAGFGMTAWLNQREFFRPGELKKSFIAHRTNTTSNSQALRALGEELRKESEAQGSNHLGFSEENLRMYLKKFFPNLLEAEDKPLSRTEASETELERFRRVQRNQGLVLAELADQLGTNYEALLEKAETRLKAAKGGAA